MICSTCKHAVADYSLSGYHIQCMCGGYDYKIHNGKVVNECVYYVSNNSGLQAHEQKHNFFQRRNLEYENKRRNRKKD